MTGSSLEEVLNEAQMLNAHEGFWTQAPPGALEDAQALALRTSEQAVKLQEAKIHKKRAQVCVAAPAIIGMAKTAAGGDGAWNRMALSGEEHAQHAASAQQAVLEHQHVSSDDEEIMMGLPSFNEEEELDDGSLTPDQYYSDEF